MPRFLLSALILTLAVIPSHAGGCDQCSSKTSSPYFETEAFGNAKVRVSGEAETMIAENQGGIFDEVPAFKRAMAPYNEAIKQDPDDAFAYYDRAMIYHKFGEIDRAIDDYDKTISLDPFIPQAYLKRGLVHRDMDDINRAIADFAKATGLDPDYEVAFYNSGNANFTKGDLKLAIAEYDKAIGLSPNFTQALLHRAVAHVYLGSLPEARSDFESLKRQAPNNGYLGLWRHVAERRNDLPGQLGDTVSSLDMDEWPAEIIRFYLGQSTPEAVFAAAEVGDRNERINQIGQALFFLGDFALLAGDNVEAKRLFERCVDDCEKRSVEYRAALAELRQMTSDTD